MAVFLLLIAAGQLGIHDYLQFRSWGIINTYFAIILSNMFYPVNAIILGTYYNQKTGNKPAGFMEYIRECFPAIICLFIGTLLLNMDSYTSSLLYMNRPDGQSPSSLIYRLIKTPR